jgi:ankyrin repeat protein
LEYGADVNIPNEKGMTTLFVAANDRAAAELPISHGANIFSRDQPGQAVVAFCRSPQVVDLLLEMGADIADRHTLAEQMPMGPPVLSHLAGSGSDQGVASILTKHVLGLADRERKCHILAQTNSLNESLLHSMASNGLPTCVKLFVDAEVPINPIQYVMKGQSSLEPETPLDFAVSRYQWYNKDRHESTKRGKHNCLSLSDLLSDIYD